MNVRPFEAHDQDEVRELVLDGLRERFGALDPTLNRDLDDIAASYVSRGHVFLVIEDDAQIVATGALRADGDLAEIVRVSVRATHRRRGIGTEITAALIREARRANAARVVIKTFFPEAIALYESAGFLRTGEDGGGIVFELDLGN